MPESKQAGYSRLFILFHFFLLLFPSTVSRGKGAEFLILWECSALFSWEMSEAAADLNERSSSLKICHAVINAGFCWWAADGSLMSLAVLQGTAVPPDPFPPLPAHPGSGFHHVKAKISLQHSRATLSLKKGSCLVLSSSQQLPFSPDWCSLLAY